ncbi:hypothetical protein D9611_014618 [Ephemerocybe angulata]|uniref:Reverse transcriptase domain-containing protein n=1 Tax=Ephemerocybe angulata TaxID=980116 RepID=A0A8H5FIQ3_9AGAR|nr:hypothetical protein D9611_014618 [Tulosesus angulatus]
MVGDFNVVEDALDRIPPKAGKEPTVNALRDLKQTLSLIDGWRKENPEEKAYTWKQVSVDPESDADEPDSDSDEEPDEEVDDESGDEFGGENEIRDGCVRRSRIDRIYVQRGLYKSTRNWETYEPTVINTDHELVMVTYYDLDSPYIGTGRWQMPGFLLKNKEYLKYANIECKKAEKKMKEWNDQSIGTDNRQTTFAKLKVALQEARDMARVMIPRTKAKIKSLKDDLKAVLNDTTVPDRQRSARAQTIETSMNKLEADFHNNKRENAHTKAILENETIGKYWIQSNKEKLPRDTMQLMKDPTNHGAPPITRSQDMAQAARDYHEKLQVDVSHSEEERRTAMELVLDKMDYRLNPDDKQTLAALLDREIIYEALMSMPNGKAPGPDGIPTELWKDMARAHKQATERNTAEDEKPADIIGILMLFYNDIETNGVTDNSDFAKGWMCPIYKKKDRTDIANYRPITVLNADYKVFTKAQTIRLGPIALKFIHPDQAGFMKGQRIDDHTELIKLMIEWCDVEQENGVLVFLDQEKAYDRITHAFLLRSLETLGFPDHFCKIIRSLYDKAETVVILNGVISKPYKITRGVRQGDPLSCLLFNIAIESLANLLRKSSLQGFKIDENIERLITTLFADDTTVYLSEHDNFQDLQNILQLWCDASGAKFNVEKTELVPVGPQEYRDTLLTTRRTRIQDEASRIPEGIKIAKDGEPVRALGAFVGNKVDNPSVWTTTLEILDSKVDFWLKSKPSLEGRSYITKIEAGGRTQYRTVVQGMSKDVERRVEKSINRIMWGSAPAGVNHETTILPYEKGGKKALDIPLRNQSIDLMRVLTFLGENIPRWVYPARALIARDIPKSQNVDDLDAARSVFQQTWHTRKQAEVSRLPLSLKNMIRTAEKYNICFTPPAVTTTIKNAMPIWYHPGRKPGTRLAPNNGAIATCLRNVHGVYTVGDLQWLVDNFPHPTQGPGGTQPGSASGDESDDSECQCEKCRRDRAHGCEDPAYCHDIATNILDSLKPKWNPDDDRIDLEELLIGHEMLAMSFIPKGSERLFTPKLDEYTKESNGYRLFGKARDTWIGRPMDIKTAKPQIDEVTVYYTGTARGRVKSVLHHTCYSVIRNGPPAPQMQRAAKVPKQTPLGTTTASIFAILETLEMAGVDEDIKIYVNSKQLVDELTDRLTINEDMNWTGNKNRAQMRVLVAKLRTRSGITILSEYDKNAQPQMKEGRRTERD